MYFWDELGDSPIPSESGAGSESGFGSPASEVRLRKDSVIWEKSPQPEQERSLKPDRVGLDRPDHILEPY